MVMGINSGDFCGKVIADLEVSASLNAYRDEACTIMTNNWPKYVQAPAHFKANFTSAVSTITAVANTVTISVFNGTEGEPTPITLLDSGLVTPEGHNLSFIVAPPSVSVSSGLLFTFHVWKVFKNFNATINSTISVTAHLTLSLMGGQKRNNLHLKAPRIPFRRSNTKSIYISALLSTNEQDNDGMISYYTEGPGEEDLLGMQRIEEGQGWNSIGFLVAASQTLVFRYSGLLLAIVLSVVILLAILNLVFMIVRSLTTSNKATGSDNHNNHHDNPTATTTTTTTTTTGSATATTVSAGTPL